MKTQQQIIISEVTQSNKQSKTSANGGYVPTDLLIDIFSRLPAKSIARCSCVSKPWDSMLRLPSFTELFLTRSLTRPRLLFACHKRIDSEVSFFSSTQPHIIDENSSLLTASYQMKIWYNFDFKFERFSPIRGLVFLENKRFEEPVRMEICNPTTRQSWTLPKMMSRRRIGVRSYVGYDPVEKIYKVLCMTWKEISNRRTVCEEHQVMILGSREPSWRKIECRIPHFSTENMNNQICINGVLYYIAFESVESSAGNLIIVCFDVKSEKFSVVRYMQTMQTEYGTTPLINCNGKLGSLFSDRMDYFHGLFTNHMDYFHRGNTSLTLWVLEDAEKPKWFKHTYLLPALWKDIVGNLYLRVVGMTQTNEIVLSTCFPCVPYYIIFYNTETKKITRVEIQGMETFKPWDIYTYLDHIEDVKLMQM